MYKMKADGVVFYDPSADDLSLQVISPKASYELNRAGSLEFTLLPGNVAYDSIEKLKTIVTLEQDGEVIFRGRVLETKKDTYNQQEVHCEGELAYLLDSLIRPYKFKGNAVDLFRTLLTNHNDQVEEYKRFEPGIITAVKDTDNTEIKGGAFTDALSEIKDTLVDVYGGYLRVRHADGVRYLDYVDAFEQTCTQEITFGVNIVEIESTVSVQDLCTVLVPLGKNNLTIEDVNKQKDYLEYADLIEKYGRIVKTKVWDDVSDPLDLMRLGQEYMKLMNADTTLTITAVDMRNAGVDVDAIHLGDTVKLNSTPHCIEKEDVCTSVEINIENPEKSEYTFGIPRESLTKAQANSARIMRNTLLHHHKWLSETETALNINVESVNLIGHRTTQLEIDVDAAEEAILLKASQESVDVLEEAHKEALIRLDAAEAEILLKASNETVEELGNRLSHAEINIDGANAAIELKASKTDMDDVFLRLSAAEGTLNAQANEIALKASNLRVDAIETTITGLVKLDDLSTKVLEVVDGANIYDLTATNLTAYYIKGVSATYDNISASSISMGGEIVATEDWVESQQYLKSVPSTYATQSWVIEKGYATSSDVATTLTGFVMTEELNGYATEAWVRENFSKASTTYKPTVIERYGSVSENCIPVQALNESGTVLLTGTVDAGDVYTAGENAGYSRGHKEGASSVYIKSLETSGESYNRTYKTISASMDVELSTDATSQHMISVDASMAYSAGKDDVTCTSVSLSSETAGSLYVTVKLSNGKSVTKSVDGW